MEEGYAWLEIDTNEEEIMLLSSPENSPKKTYQWDTEEEEELLRSPTRQLTPSTSRKAINWDAEEENKVTTAAELIKSEPEGNDNNDLPPTPGRNTVWTSVRDVVRIPVILAEEDQYKIQAEDGTYFNIHKEEVETIPFSRIKKMKKKKYTVFLKNNKRVRVKIVNGKVIWYNHRERLV